MESEFESGSGDFSVENHLLLTSNSLVFEKVLTYLEHRDKANVRRVCKQWEELSQTKWRSNSTFQINGMLVIQSEDNGNSSRYSQPNRLSMKEIVEQVLHVNYNVPNDPWNLSKYPFRKLKINGDQALSIDNYHTRFVLLRHGYNKLGIGIMDDVETGFWNFFGHTLKYLELNEVCLAPGGATQLHRILSEFTPNLKEFVYTQNDCTRRDPVSVDNVTRGIQPNLTSITIHLTTGNYLIVFRNRAKLDEDRCTSHFKDGLEETPPLGLVNNNGEFLRHVMEIESRYEFNKEQGLILATQNRLITLDEDTMFHTIFPFDWKLIYETFPNLKKIALYFSGPCTGHEYAFRLFQTFALDQIRFIGQVRKEKPNTLNIDSWHGILYGADVNKFCELALPIRSFAGKFEASESQFRQFLTSHENTLKELTIAEFERNDVTKAVKNMWLPPGLTYLEMDYPWGKCLDFLKHVPNLETLIFNNEENRNRVAKFSSSFGVRSSVQPLTQMKEFRCKLGVNNDAFNKISNLMPNLKKLTIEMGNQRWMTASLNWSRLEYLVLLQSHRHGSLLLNQETFVRYADRFQDLTTFEFVPSSKSNFRHRVFSDLSIYEGFLKMERLQNLKIEFSREVSDEAMAAVKLKIPHADIEKEFDIGKLSQLLGYDVDSTINDPLSMDS